MTPLQCIADLAAHLRQLWDIPAVDIALDPCPGSFAGDVTINCFRLAGPLRRNPMQAAKTIGEWLAEHPEVRQVEVIKAFVNIALEPGALMRDSIADAARLQQQVALPATDRRRILVEYSAPNTNKPQHLGHVRNNTLGVAVSGILARAGHDVVRVNLVNDRGIAICKSMLAYQRFGDRCTPAGTGKKGDHLIGDFYVRFDSEFQSQVAALRRDRPAFADAKAEELFLETEIGRAAHALLTAWEAGDAETMALWRQLNDWVLEGFAETYRRYGVAFDRTYYESDTYLLGKDIVQQGLAEGVFRTRHDGAVEIDLTDEGLDPKVVLRSDGTSVYVTQDLGTTLLKERDFHPDTMIWVVGDEQIYHFKVLFAILQRLGYSWADDLHHLAYGMVHLPSGKMKSREGTVVDADDLYEEMVSLAQAATAQRHPDAGDAELGERARVIGLAALKFMLLKVSPKTTIKFDPEAAIRFEGDTGPYVLYAYARIASMRRKEGETDMAPTPEWGLLGEPEERELALTCARYPETVSRAAAELDPSVLASYLLDLTKVFNRFYKRHSVLGAATPALRRTRFALCERVSEVLADGLRALGIETLEAM